MKEYLSREQTLSYLERIGCGEGLPREEYLDDLVFFHQKAVPFETYEINKLGKTPSLGLGDLYEKVVIRRCGGFCFELNKLFEALLHSLGFDVRPVLCRAVERTGRSPINHRGMVVHIDGGLRFVDVGYGGPMPAASLALRDGATQNIHGDLFFTRRVDDTWWAVDRVTKGVEDFFDDDIPSRRQTELELCLSEVEDFDFDLLCLALSQPGSLFKDHLIANLRTNDGYVALMDNVLTLRSGGAKSKIDLSTDEEVNDALKRYFGVEYLGAA